MDEKFPISNIPLIFTQYRSKVLEESGKQWFHADNHPHAQPMVSKALADDSVQVTEGNAVVATLTEAELKLDAVKPGLEPHPDYVYPDPWASDVVDSSLIQSSSDEPTDNEFANDEQANAHPSQNVNLFPFDSSSEEVSHEVKYDLTEFDNGEIEVPPVAVRDSHLSKFEKVDQGLTHETQFPLNEDESPNMDTPRDKRNSRPKPASAEIAKYRLRNCI